jgi:hypothetical protein
MENPLTLNFSTNYLDSSLTIFDLLLDEMTLAPFSRANFKF